MAISFPWKRCGWRKGGMLYLCMLYFFRMKSGRYGAELVGLERRRGGFWTRLVVDLKKRKNMRGRLFDSDHRISICVCSRDCSFDVQEMTVSEARGERKCSKNCLAKLDCVDRDEDKKFSMWTDGLILFSSRLDLSPSC